VLWKYIYLLDNCLMLICQDHNDPLKNDAEWVLDEGTLDGLRHMGAFGLQVPEKYGLRIVLTFSEIKQIRFVSFLLG